MKKILLLFGIVLFLSGCGHIGKSEVLKNFNKNINNLKSYYLEGEMDITNGEDLYKYDVTVSYKDNDYYKVTLLNQTNNHEQVILKNESGIYVITPSLNRSFKFESEWPSTNSQAYLPQSILLDLNNDSNLKFETENDLYKFTVKVNYPNNKKLVEQNIYIDKEFNLVNVDVLDESSNKIIQMKFNKFEKNKAFNDDYFDMDSVETFSYSINTSSIENAIFPMFLPSNTVLEKQETINYEDGERLILTFEGDNPFVLIEETISSSDELEIIPTIGDPVMLADSIGILSDNSISWISNGLEYYIASEVMSIDDILEVANSLGTVPVMK